MPEKDDGKTVDIADLDVDYQAAYYLQEALTRIETMRNKATGQVGRHCSIAITDLEKVIAYWDYYVTRSDLV